MDKVGSYGLRFLGQEKVGNGIIQMRRRFVTLAGHLGKILQGKEVAHNLCEKGPVLVVEVARPSSLEGKHPLLLGGQFSALLGDFEHPG